MKKVLNIEKLLLKKDIYNSVTITPKDENGVISAKFYLNQKTQKGFNKIKTVKYNDIINFEILPEISNFTVAHLGYKKYYYLKEPNFYINLYF